MRMRHCILTAVAIGLVLTGGVPRVASAMVFFCGSGDVSCVIRTIESAKWGPGTGHHHP
jgi:hypothetical protein